LAGFSFKTINAFDIPDAWRKCVSAIWHEGDIFIVKSGSECTETKKLALTVIISNPENKPLVDDKCETTNEIKAGKYALEYLYTDSCHYGESEDDEEYTYGSRLRDGREYIKKTKTFIGNPIDQVKKIVQLIAKEPLNRQLTMTIRIPSDVNSPHPPCLTMIDFEPEYVDGHWKLNIYAYFRSWDGYAGFPENIAGLQIFNQAIVDDVNEILIAEGEKDEDLFTAGKMIFFSKNCHLYKRQYEWAEKLEPSGQDSRRMSK
jgi:thymidylate synthase